MGVPISTTTRRHSAIIVLSGVQLIALGILGEYVWRTLDAARRRPSFIVGETRNLAASPPSPPHHHETTTQ
jgi:dolichol-phosphate mannosyltransferase